MSPQTASTSPQEEDGLGKENELHLQEEKISDVQEKSIPILYFVAGGHCNIEGKNGIWSIDERREKGERKHLTKRMG